MTILSSPIERLSSPIEPGSSQKLLYLMNDFVVQEHVCNLRCSYCLNFENENLKEGEPWKPLERIKLNTGSFGWSRAKGVLEKTRQSGNAPILRVAGGEIAAIQGNIPFITEEARHWDRVQILTNGTFLQRDIDQLKKIPSINLCCSVDGHTAELNSERTPHKKWAQRIIDGLLSAIDAAVPVEVYMVVTKKNVDAIYDFAHWIYELPRVADVRLLPFPVRGDIGSEMRPSTGQYRSLARLLEDYDRLKEILPPLGFLHRLHNFCTTEVRNFRCRIPLGFLQTFDDGVLASCSNCWASPLGNILEDDHILNQVGNANIHKLFMRDPPRFPFCKTCFTPFDVVNVYLDGLCELEDIAQMDLYSSLAVRERLSMLKDTWAEPAARGVWS